MFEVDCILFDCMETLIDLKEYPDLRLYAAWAYYSSGCEDDWNSFENFFEDYKIAKDFLDSKHENYQEYNIYDRFEMMINKRFKNKDSTYREKLYKKISYNYWENYKDNSYVRDEVKALLKRLEKQYSLAVVSNFMKEDGVEELLKENDVFDYFDFIVTSIKTGWRKPNQKIYHEAIIKAGVSIDKILFIGDNYHCDYQEPRKLGLKSIILDRENKYQDINDRISSLEQIEQILNFRF